MKKTCLILVMVLTFSILASHEISVNGSMIIDGKPQGRGLYLNMLNLWWQGEDWRVDLNLTDVIDDHTSRLDGKGGVRIAHAWKHFDLWGLGDLYLGQQPKPFGRLLSTKGSQTMTILPLFDVQSCWLARYHNELFVFDYDLYTSMPLSGLWDMGLKGYWSKSDYLNLGAAAKLEDVTSSDNRNWQFAFDAEITAFQLINFSFQIENIIGTVTEFDNNDFHALISHAPGFELPYVSKRFGRVLYGLFRPYVGYVTRYQQEEDNILVGINFESYENPYFKIEYNMDSDEDNDSLTIQLGYIF